MLNFQIRGYKLESCIGSLSKFDFSDMINCIKLEKKPLTELIFEEHNFGHWKNFDDIIKISTPLLSIDSELQVTYFDENDYYNDGYTFFRVNPDKLSRKDLKLYLDIPNTDYLILNSAIFQGNCFETDINDQSYNHFTKQDIHIDCMDISWIDKRTISKIYFRGNELKDKVKEKNQLIRFTTMIIKPDKDTFMTQIDNMDLIQRSDKVYQAIK